MLNLWLKVMYNHKIIAQNTLKMFQPYSRQLLESMIKSMLEQMDLPAPVFTSSHFINFEKFKSVKFLKRDFVETISGDFIEVADIS